MQCLANDTTVMRTAFIQSVLCALCIRNKRFKARYFLTTAQTICMIEQMTTAAVFLAA